MEYLLIFIVLVAVVWFFTRKDIQYGSPEEKKEQIRIHYTKELQEALNSIQDPNKKRHVKLQMLKKINDELSRNVFFDPHESKELLQKLSCL
ncbi:MAG: hypothetical protein U9N30_02615 [Campylobacterota bacterium]|nr:hypothetical protein [Campylobacterota bacterium]